jgi:imidazolonepropionase-like amidohydrolase/ABC-type multidrug transport system permease subunit
MKAYIAHIKMSLLLMTRNRGAFIMGYGFPLAFLFLFGSFGGAAVAGTAMGMVLTIGVLGTGLFGGAMVPVMNREQNILRRFKVAPITPGPILVSGIMAGMVMYLPMAFLMLALANRLYHVPFPTQPVSLFLFIALGIVTFCTIGNMIASVVNTMQEAQVVIQLVYFPSLMLSGATFPIFMLPNWVQIASQFLPATHFYTGAQSILRGRETLVDNFSAVGALALTSVIGTFLAFKLFRWEKEEKVKPSAKAWLAACLAPFIVMGGYQAYAKTNIERARLLLRDQARSAGHLVHDARIFTGDGQVIERGSVLIKNGKIEKIFTGDAPDAKSLDAEAIEGAGKTLLPGLIDSRVHLMSSLAGMADGNSDPSQAISHDLAAYLYSGVTAINNTETNDLLKGPIGETASGSKLGVEVFSVQAQAPPSLSSCEAADAAMHKSTAPLDRSALIRQVMPVAQIERLKAEATKTPERPGFSCEPLKHVLQSALGSGSPISPASDAGSTMTVHGPGIHRELQLWVAAGIPAATALQGATANAAKLLKAGDRIGSIKPGYEASLLLVDGNPLDEIAATERISAVLFKGELVNRNRLFDQK